MDNETREWEAGEEMPDQRSQDDLEQEEYEAIKRDHLVGDADDADKAELEAYEK